MTPEPGTSFAPAPLDGLRVLDLAGDEGALCGRILADLGADVIKAEPPWGGASRRTGPFYPDESGHPERSLWSFAYDAGKRSVTLGLATTDGCALFRKLVASADFIVESFAPGYLDGLGLGYAGLDRLNPRVILVSITPFGQDGPYAQWQGSDLVATAMGGLMHTQGDEDRPPVAFSFPQACLHAAAEGAAGAMFAHAHRQATGRGQHVDVSMQEAVTWTLMNASQYWDLNRVVVGRSGAVKRNPSGVTARMHWPCKDGYVTFAGGAEWDGLSRWMRSAGFDHPALHREYKSLPPFALKQTEVDTLERLALDFFKERTAQELYDGALQWRIMLYPVYTMEQILRYRQLLERGFWRQVKHEGLGRTLTYPGSFIRTTMGWPQLRGRAPRVGEHNRQVYQGELGLSDADLQALKAAGAV